MTDVDGGEGERGHGAVGLWGSRVQILTMLQWTQIDAMTWQFATLRGGRMGKIFGHKYHRFEFRSEWR